MLTIKIQIKTVYGKETVYPACSRALLFAKIAGTATLTNETLRLIRALSYQFEIVHPAIDLA